MNKLFFLFLIPFALFACDNKNDSGDKVEGNTQTSAAVDLPVFTSDLAANMDQTVDKIVQLAKAIPADKYDWRPAEGVRSVSESIMHIAGANYFFSSFFGAKMPNGLNPRNLEKDVTSKDDVIATFKGSYDNIKDVLQNFPAEKLVEEIDFPDGNTYNKQQALLIALGHTSEHLGQLIAYARSMGVTPPWSQPLPES